MAMNTFIAALILVAFMMVALGLGMLLTGKSNKSCCSKNPHDPQSGEGGCGSCSERSPTCEVPTH